MAIIFNNLTSLAIRWKCGHTTNKTTVKRLQNISEWLDIPSWMAYPLGECCFKQESSNCCMLQTILQLLLLLLDTSITVLVLPSTKNKNYPKEQVQVWQIRYQSNEYESVKQNLSWEGMSCISLHSF